MPDSRWYQYLRNDGGAVLAQDLLAYDKYHARHYLILKTRIISWIQNGSYNSFKLIQYTRIDFGLGHFKYQSGTNLNKPLAIFLASTEETPRNLNYSNHVELGYEQLHFDAAMVKLHRIW